MDSIKEVEPGIKIVPCFHIKHDPEGPHEKLIGGMEVVLLEKIPNRVGYHGTCPKCGSRYFSRDYGESGE